MGRSPSCSWPCLRKQPVAPAGLRQFRPSAPSVRTCTCSEPCFGTGQPMPPEPDIVCATCGRHFVPPIPRHGLSRQRTCSRSCASRVLRRRVPLEERFWRHVQRTESCWLWTGLHVSSGAGVLPVREGGNVRRRTAARVAWELFVGPLPHGRRLWRRCRKPACVRPDHLVLVRRGQSGQVALSQSVAGSVHTLGRPDSRRTYWTRQRVVAGLLAFHRATGQAPTSSRNWAGLIRLGDRQQRFPTAYAVLRHFPSFRAAWTSAGIELVDASWAPWTAEHDQ
jgi:hypothetical protein